MAKTQTFWPGALLLVGKRPVSFWRLLLLGAGIGLAAVHRILSDMAGEFWTEAQLDDFIC
jgi:hypothetical protein